jgi:type II secretory pathway component GspD/PulD (secretin)
MTGQTLRRLGLASVFGAVLALPVAAQERERQDPTNQPQERSTEKQQTKTEKAKWTVKAFDLKHRNPEEMNQILTSRWDDPSRIAPQGVAVVIGPGGYPVRVGVPQPAQPVAATQRTSGYRESDSKLLVSFDPQAKLIFVRGPEAEVREAESLVKALDVPDGQLKAVEFNGMHLIPVRQEKMQQVNQTLSNLRINSHTTTVGGASFVVVREQGEDDGIVEQVRMVISKYDAGTQAGTEKTTTTETTTEKRTETTEKKDQ